MKLKVGGIIITIALIFAIALGFVPGIETAIVAHAADTSGTCSECGNIAWKLEGTTLTISKATGATSGDMCDECGENWSVYKPDIKKIIIESGVTTVGDHAFDECSALTSIKIPDSVTSIGSSAFYRCSNLLSATIPVGVTSIGNYAFYACSSLKSVTIPEGVITIGKHAFDKCIFLSNVIVPNSVTSIGNSAFSGCSGLSRITISNNVTSIEYETFRGCSNLLSVTIPDSVTSIGEGAFNGCSILTSITIPNSVASIDNFAFSGCKNLQDITIPNSVISIGQDAFSNCISLTSITIPGSVTSIGTYAFKQCNGLTSVTLSNGVKSIGQYAFYGCSALTSIIIPDSVTSVGNGAFNSCSALTSIKIPDSVTSVGNRVFSGCSSLTSITMSNTVTSIGDYAFYLCRGLTSVTIPDSVTSIGDYAFDACNSLTSITMSNAITSIGIRAFNGCSALTSIIIPDSVKSIGEGAFSGCKNLTNIIIPDSVTSMGKHALYNCDNMTDVTMPCRYMEQEIYNGNATITYTHPASICTANDATDTLTVSCTCGVQKYTATLKAPSKTGYTGKAIVATCTNKIPGFTPVITYSGNKLTNGKPVLPGTYTATLTYDESTSVSLKYTIKAPSAPAKPHKITNVVSGIHVYWPEASGVSKYGLWRSETGINGTYKWIANPTVAHFTDTKVESGKTYYYKVTTLDTVNNVHSEKSAAIGTIYVATPDITLRVNRAAGIGLGWDKIPGATGYAIYRKPYDGNSDWVRVTTITNPNTLKWDDTSVKTANGTVYRYTIRALAGSNRTILSGCRATGRTMVRLTSRDLNSAVKTGTTSIKCTWGTTTQATGYEVRFMVGDTVYKTYTIGNYKTGVKTFKDLKAGQTYKIQVRTYKKVEGVGSFYSAWSTAKTVSL